jgi:hypothetical protein
MIIRNGGVHVLVGQKISCPSFPGRVHHFLMPVVGGGVVVFSRSASPEFPLSHEAHKMVALFSFRFVSFVCPADSPQSPQSEPPSCFAPPPQLAKRAAPKFIAVCNRGPQIADAILLIFMLPRRGLFPKLSRPTAILSVSQETMLAPINIRSRQASVPESRRVGSIGTPRRR